MNWFRITDAVCTLHLQHKHKNMHVCVVILKEKKAIKLKKAELLESTDFYTQEHGKKSFFNL